MPRVAKAVFIRVLQGGVLVISELLMAYSSHTNAHEKVL